jgi:hypothetical protein
VATQAKRLNPFATERTICTNARVVGRKDARPSVHYWLSTARERIFYTDQAPPTMLIRPLGRDGIERSPFLTRDAAQPYYTDALMETSTRDASPQGDGAMD